MNNRDIQRQLAREMFEFVQLIPRSAELEWVKDSEFLYYFEAERLQTMREILFTGGFDAEKSFKVLDVGYLHGLVPEFLHRSFPNARFTIIDRPDSPYFKNQDYQKIISARNYLELLPCDVRDAARLDRKFDLIILGEIIEHFDPTFFVEVAGIMRNLLAEGGCLLITTPNAGSVAGLYRQFRGEDVNHPVIPDQTMSWGHIHLWSATLLEKTLQHYGWIMSQLRFYHGFERWRFVQMNNYCCKRPWGFLAQIPMRSLYHLSQAVPRHRGFFIAAFTKSSR